MGSNPVGASEFFLGFVCNCLSYFTTAKISFTSISSNFWILWRSPFLFFSFFLFFPLTLLRQPAILSGQRLMLCWEERGEMLRNSSTLFMKLHTIFYVSGVIILACDGIVMGSEGLCCKAPNKSLQTRKIVKWTIIGLNSLWRCLYLQVLQQTDLAVTQHDIV